ncbi:SLOG family protein [Microbacterium xylanilyticum]
MIPNGECGADRTGSSQSSVGDNVRSFPRVMVTGHRPKLMSAHQQRHSRTELERVAQKLTAVYGMEVGISGMALGADTDWAHAVLNAGVPLWSFVPFPQQAELWSDAQRSEWNELRSRAAREVVVADAYSVRALHARNDAMLNDADLVVAVWDPRVTTGGTASCVRKARDRGMPIIHVDLESLITRSSGIR